MTTTAQEGPTVGTPQIGVLALQGGVAEHERMISSLGARARKVRRPADLDQLDGLIIPGGESSVIGRLIDLAGLREALINSISNGLPTLGTCAGMVLLAEWIENPAPGQRSLGLLPIEVRRNAFGPQVDSMELSAGWHWPGEPEGRIRAAAIRAPEVIAIGAGVEVLIRASIGGVPRILGVRYENLIALSLHPELTGDPTAHRALLALAATIGEPERLPAR